MAVSTIQSHLSKTDLTLRPGYSVASLDVEVVNNSDRQASFHIVLAATGGAEQPTRQWYRITPMTSSKVPAGTHSLYTINIVDTPLPNFVGLANVTVRIISPELHAEDRHILRLRVEPSIDQVPFKLELNTSSFQDYPGQIVEIAGRIHNTSRYTLSVQLSCPGIETWITEGSTQQIRLRPNRWHKLLMVCQIPADLALSHSRDYPFQLLAVDNDDHAATADGHLEVLPTGYFALSAAQTHLSVPSPQKWLPDRQATTAQAEFQLDNYSNLRDGVQLQVLAPLDIGNSTDEDNTNEDSHDENSADNINQAADRRYPYHVTITPDSLTLEPGETQWVEADIDVQRPWIGWVKHLLIDVQARTDNSVLELRNDTETLQVKVFPIIPRWLQASAMLFIIGAITGLWFFQSYRQQHRQLVSTVQFNGTGNRVISGSTDQTLRQWQVGRRLRSANGILRLEKAVRVLRFRPVDNNQLAVGLENGEIQLWDLLQSSDQIPLTLIAAPGQAQGNRDDRVMALAPTTDARYLFSGYGSGQVAQWNISPEQTSRASEITQPTRQIFIPELAISDIALVDPRGQTLAIAGRYNKLLLWQWPQTAPQDQESDSAVVSLDYPDGGQNDYITSLATAEQQPFRLATADNQGRITIWDLETCLQGTENIDTDRCTVLDQWQPEPGSAIRSIALSANGCYLVSGSDRGQLTLWPLTRQGHRLTKYLQGQSVKTIQSRLNSVDIKALENRLLIVSGAEDHRVRLHRVNDLEQTCQE